MRGRFRRHLAFQAVLVYSFDWTVVAVVGVPDFGQEFEGW